MADLREQRVCIKFCFKLAKTTAEMHQMLKQAFGDSTLGPNLTSISKTTENRRPPTGITPENVTKVRDLILEDHTKVGFMAMTLKAFRHLSPKKARQVKSNIKSMLICFFYIDRFVHKEFVPPGQTVNKEFYRSVLRRLRKDAGRNVHRSGAQLTGCSAMTAHDCIWLTLCRNLWLKTRWQLFPTHHTHQT
jgi:hypothetical protein